MKNRSSSIVVLSLLFPVFIGRGSPLKLVPISRVTFPASLRTHAQSTRTRAERQEERGKANSTRVRERAHAVARPRTPVMNMHFPPLSMCRLRRDTVHGRSLLSLAATRRRFSRAHARTHVHARASKLLIRVNCNQRYSLRPFVRVDAKIFPSPLVRPRIYLHGISMNPILFRSVETRRIGKARTVQASSTSRRCKIQRSTSSLSKLCYRSSLRKIRKFLNMIFARNL